MKKVAAGAFKAKCLAVMDDVQANGKRETVVITKHGRPVLKLVPVDAPKNVLVLRFPLAFSFLFTSS
jgi:prevent-host-death family protein